MTEDNLAFAAKLPPDQQAIIKQYAKELELYINNSNPFSVDTRPEAWYNHYAKGQSDRTGLAFNPTEGKFASRESAIEFLKQEYAKSLNAQGEDSPQGRDFITRERAYGLARAAYHISNEDLGLSQTDVNKLQEMTQKAWIGAAQELYADSKSKVYEPDLALKMLEGVRYSLEKAGLDLQSDETYKRLGTTRDEFNQYYQVTDDRVKSMQQSSLPYEHRKELAGIRGTLAQVQLTGGTPTGFITAESRTNKLG